jgi:hypothetical protein
MNQRVSRHWRPWFLGLIAALGVACGSDTTNTDGMVVPEPPPPDKTPKVVFSELMYHPVDENAYDDNHEFLELYNRSDAAVDISDGSSAAPFRSPFRQAPRSHHMRTPCSPRTRPHWPASPVT